MSDVDPATMTLSEIYGHPESFFEPANRYYDYEYAPNQYGHIYTPYGGSILRINGRSFFTVKDDGIDDHNPAECSWCADLPQGYWPWNALSVDPQESKRAHP